MKVLTCPYTNIIYEFSLKWKLVVNMTNDKKRNSREPCILHITASKSFIFQMTLILSVFSLHYKQKKVDSLEKECFFNL